MKQFLNGAAKAAVRDWRVWPPIVLFLLVGGIALNDVLVYNPDSARYLIWAQSLSQLKGYTDLSLAEPFHYVVHAPLYPVLLVPAALLAPGSVVAAKILTLLLGVVFLYLMYRWLLRMVPPMMAMAGVLVLALHPLMVLYSNQVLSEIPFGMAIVAAFLMVERLDGDSGERLQTLLPLAGILTAGIFLREVGVTLMLGAVLYFLVRRQYRSALFIFLVPMIFYLLWFLRNEVIVAGAEHPPLRNSEIFTLHYFTDRKVSLFTELFARLKINASIYWNQILNLTFLPQYPSSYGVFFRTLPPYSSVIMIAGPLYLVFALFAVGIAVVGIIRSIKANRSTIFFLTFVPIYVLLIFFYPFNDIRFLFPLLLFFVYYGTAGISYLLQVPWLQRRRVGTPALIVLIALLMVPNLAWCFAYARDNAMYRASPLSFYDSTVNDPNFPDLLTKPTGAVGAWLEEHHAGSATVLTPWKEVAFWHPQGKIAEANSLLPLNEFESLIRDYRIEYVVSAVGLAGIPEYYQQMVLSTRFRFNSVYRVSNFEIFRVSRASGSSGVYTPSDYGIDTTQLAPEVRRVWSEQLLNRRLFAEGLQAIAANHLDTAKGILRGLSIKTRGSMFVVLYLAIAHEFAGEYGAAQSLLKGLQVVRQSGAFLGQSASHLEIIRLLEQAKWETKPALKAEYYNVVSIRLWGLGFRRQSLDALTRSLEADPEFFPSFIFGIYFNLQEGHRDAAWDYLRRLEKTRPGHPLIEQFGTILSLKDSLKRTSAPGRQSSYHLRIANALEKAGLGDGAIDELSEWLQVNPNDEQSWKELSRLYSTRLRYAPSLRAARQAADLDPNDTEAKDAVTELLKLW